ncbi:hypothetical protein SeLEV6574_g01748 [Synchytrium endobioticum]|uniref:DH domain-containing protein n=1 Tax=Synchytrium endobioticum TaxID=286115 RepID=A0A507DBJ9_9FUNG|nr:hypothetical protein SeLEV6574_g01748 [Synchytrium endobioticum]
MADAQQETLQAALVTILSLADELRNYNLDQVRSRMQYHDADDAIKHLRYVRKVTIQLESALTDKSNCVPSDLGSLDDDSTTIDDYIFFLYGDTLSQKSRNSHHGGIASSSQVSYTNNCRSAEPYDADVVYDDVDSSNGMLPSAPGSNINDFVAGKRPAANVSSQSSTIGSNVDRSVSTKNTPPDSSNVAPIIPRRSTASSASGFLQTWEPVTEATLDTEKSYTVRIAFNKANDEEINLKVADNVSLLVPMGGNMVWGTNNVTGAEGLFPISCLVHIPERSTNPGSFSRSDPNGSRPSSMVNPPTRSVSVGISSDFDNNSSLARRRTAPALSSTRPGLRCGRHVAIASSLPPPGNEIEVPLTVGDEVDVTGLFDENPDMVIGTHVGLKLQGIFKRSCLKLLENQLLSPYATPAEIASQKPTLLEIVQKAIESGNLQGVDITAAFGPGVLPACLPSTPNNNQAVPTLTDSIIPDITRTYQQWRANNMQSQFNTDGTTRPSHPNDMLYLRLLQDFTQNMATRNTTTNRQEQEEELRMMVNPPVRTVSAAVPQRQLTASLATHQNHFPHAYIPPRTFPVTSTLTADVVMAANAASRHGLVISDEEAVDRVIRETQQEQQKEREKAVMIVTELIETEKNYRDGLKVLNDKVIGTFYAVAGTSNEILRRAELDLFRNVPDLLRLTTDICEKLEATRESHPDDPITIANVFLQYTPEMTALYPLYTKNFAIIKNLFDELLVRRDNRGVLFRDFLAAHENTKAWQRQDLLHFIILPIRRIPSMWLIFQRLVGRCDPHHPSYRCIPATEDYLYELGAVLNKVQKDESAALALTIMKRQVEHLPLDASDTTKHRYISAYDAVDPSRRPPKSLRLFLLADALILTSVNPPSRRYKEHDVQKKYTFMYALDVHSCCLEENTDASHEHDMLRLVPNPSSASIPIQPVQQHQRISIFSSSSPSNNVNALNPDGSMALNPLTDPLTLKIMVNMQQPGAPRDFVHNLKDAWAGKIDSGPRLY